MRIRRELKIEIKGDCRVKTSTATLVSAAKADLFTVATFTGTMPQFAIYSASAGSGKTYTLTLEYLTLALAPDDPAAFKRILALTFTNDAAGEMKRRIVEALRELATGQESALLQELSRRLAITPQVLQSRASAMFQRVLYDYADFAVGTIDSFGQRIVTSFARDLGLPATFEVELDTDAVLAAAVGLLLDRVNRGDADDDALTQLLRDYADEAGQEGKSLWGLAERVADFSHALFNDTHLDVVALLSRADVAEHQRWRAAVTEYLRTVEERVEALGAGAMQLIADAGLTEKSFFQSKSGIYGYFLNARGKWENGELPNSYVRKTIDEDNWLGADAKKSPLKEKVEAIKDDLRGIYEAIEALRTREHGGYLLLRAMQPHALGVALLGEVQKLVEAISRERGVVLIGEFNRRIAGVVLREPVPFVYEKLGDRYQHLLLDEFQDTSALQWHNLLPLIENSLGNDFRSLAVGDAKQAIYRWRGGELEQIMRLYRHEPTKLLDRVRDPETRALLQMRYETLGPALQDQTLRENWRSRPEIVRFNNLLFTFFATRWGSQVPLLAELYDDDFQQETPDKLRQGPAGHVEIITAPEAAPARPYDVPTGQYGPAPLPGHAPDATLDYEETQLNLTLALIEQARTDGFAYGDLAVLCRTRAQSRAVAKQLKERGYPISSADSLALSFADAVNLLVQLLRVLHQPADGPARAAALLLLDKLVTQRAPGPERLQRVAELSQQKESRPFWDEVNTATTQPFEPLTAGNLGLYELAEQLTSALGLLAAAPAEAEYVFGFLDLTLEYSLRYGNNVGGFLDFWEQSGRNRPISTPGAGRDAITIQTVHKAKGLAYGVVIVPFADWPLRPRAGSLLWAVLPEGTELPVPDLPRAAVVTQSDKLTTTALGPQHLDEQQRTFVEVLNLLYVAFTRPKHRLYIITKQLPKAPADADKLPARLDALLYDFLTTQGWEPGQLRHVFSTGDRAPAPKVADLHLADAVDRAPWGLTNLSAVPWTERLHLKRHATTVFDFVTQDRVREASQRLHLALKHLSSAADLEQVLYELRTEGIIRADEQAELRAELTTLLQHPRLAPYFAAGVAAETERPILLHEVGGQPTDYQPDRVIFGPSPDQITLLDFRIPPPDPQHQQDQRRHAELFRRLGYQYVQGLIYYLGTGEIAETGL